MRVLGVKPTAKKTYYAIADKGFIVDKGVLPENDLIDDFLVEKEIEFIVFEKGYEHNYKGIPKKINAAASKIVIMHWMAQHYGIEDRTVTLDHKKLNLFGIIDSDDHFIDIAVQAALSYFEDSGDYVIET